MEPENHSDHPWVLIVDDEPSVCHLADRILRKLGCFTLIAYDGQEALEALRSHFGTIHLLVSDVNMPGLNGPELCRQIKQDSPKTACLLMSGDISGVRMAKGVHFLSKPFTADALLSKVQELLANAKPSWTSLELTSTD